MATSDREGSLDSPEKPEVKRTEAEATGQSAKEKKSGAEEDEDGSGDVEFSVFEIWSDTELVLKNNI